MRSWVRLVSDYFHPEIVETEGKGFVRKIKASEYERLERRLRKLGWKNFKWCPAGDSKEIDYRLYGLPPKYKVKKGDLESESPESYVEEVIRTLVNKKGVVSGVVLVRDYLEGPIYDALENVAWGYFPKESLLKILFEKV